MYDSIKRSPSYTSNRRLPPVEDMSQLSTIHRVIYIDIKKSTREKSYEIESGDVNGDSAATEIGISSVHKKQSSDQAS
jgi:hypothetical protein